MGDFTPENLSLNVVTQRGGFRCLLGNITARRDAGGESPVTGVVFVGQDMTDAFEEAEYVPNNAVLRNIVLPAVAERGSNQQQPPENLAVLEPADE